MISIIPYLDVMKSVVDKNITSPASKVRVSAFNEADLLANPRNKDVEIVLEGNLFDRISVRLNDDHKMVFRNIYEIEESALKTPNYNIIKSIKFISEEKKLKLNPKNKIIILTENTVDFQDLSKNPRVVIITPKEFLIRIEKLKEIINEYDTLYGAMTTTFFFK